MILNHFIESADVLDDKYAEWYEYILRDCSLTEVVGFSNFLDPLVKRTIAKKQLKFPYFEVLKSLSESERDEILENCGLDEIDFSPNGISSKKSIVIVNFDKLGPPPFKIVKARWFDLGDIKAMCESVTEIPNWLPEVDQKCTLYIPKIKSISKIDTRLKSCGELMIYLDKPLKSGLLSLLKIKNLYKFSAEVSDYNHIVTQEDEEDWKDFEKAIKIVTKFLGRRDPLGCQEALFDAGLEEYAAL